MEGTLKDYRKEFHSGKILGGDVFRTLAPGAGMRVLDLGCGDGLLTRRIADAGADVVGVDADPSFVSAAQELGLKVSVCDGHCLEFTSEFDRVFSNATLHWLSRDPMAVLFGVKKALRPGGKFVAEFGGQGNVSTIVAAVSAELGTRGLDPEVRNPWFFPGAEQYSSMLTNAGFRVERCELVDYPTQLEGEMSGWLRTFLGKWLHDLDHETSSSIRAAVSDALKPTLFKNGKWTIDYVRIRVVAENPDLTGAASNVGEPLLKRARPDGYSDRSYGSIQIGFGAALGIVVVDLQKAFTTPKHRLGGSAHINCAVEQTARLLKVARSRKVPVACCYVAYGNGSAMPHWKVDAVRNDLFRGMEGTELDPRISDPTYDFVFEKWGASAFFQTPLVAYFVKHRIDTVAICGCTTSGCVRASLVDSFQFGFRTMMVQDCCGDQEDGPHKDVVRDVGRRYADIVSAQDTISWISEHMPNNE